MDLLLIVLFMSLGTTCGITLATRVSEPTDETLILLATVGGLAGTAVAYALLGCWKCVTRRFRKEPSPSQRSLSPAHTPVDFPARLARFVSRDRHVGLVHSNDHFKSSMPFWYAIDRVMRVPPKSAEVIRQTLRSIRRALRS